MPLVSPALQKRLKMTEPADVLQAPLIQSAVSVVQWSDWLASVGVAQGPERYALRFDRAQLSLDAAIQGLGVALESATMAAPHLESGRLVPLFSAKQSVRVQAHFVVYPKRHAKRKEIAAFLAWLRTQCAP